MHVGGEELPMHDPRCSPGIATSFVMDATPGRHTQYGAWLDEASFLPPDLGHHHIEDKYDYSGKGGAHKYISSWGHIVNSTGCCMFGWTVAPAPAMPRFLTAAMGREFSMEDILLIGERIANLRTAFNVREGVCNLELKIPKRVVGEPPLKAGPTADVTVDYRTEIREYLEAMGWDTETGAPTAATLRRLGLDYAAEALYPR
jgi:aldehyde:ferredoxin oxidoreductase